MFGHSNHSPDKGEKRKPEQEISTHSLEWCKQHRCKTDRNIHQECNQSRRKHGWQIPAS
jgi:hypothetical protein